VGVVKKIIKIIIIIKLENEIVISEIVFGMVHGDPSIDSKKSPYISSDYSSLKLILLVDGCQCDYITKSKEQKKKTLV
jgi:hypothetical protein